MGTPSLGRQPRVYRQASAHGDRIPTPLPPYLERLRAAVLVLSALFYAIFRLGEILSLK
jgi:hypothetical protein